MRGQGIVLKYIINRKRENYRASVVVSKKVSKLAVRRNRIRRRIYEIIRLSDIKEPFDIVFIIQDDKFYNIPFEQIENTIRTLLKRANIIASIK